MNKDDVTEMLLEAAHAAAEAARTAVGDAGKRIGQEQAVEFAQVNGLAETAKVLAEAAEVTSRV